MGGSNSPGLLHPQDSLKVGRLQSHAKALAETGANAFIAPIRKVSRDLPYKIDVCPHVVNTRETRQRRRRALAACHGAS